jgi:hypothetical protein
LARPKPGAVDGDQRVVGANRVARRSLLLDDRGLQAGVSLWTMFKQDLELFRRKDRADFATRLVIAGGHDSRSALVTPPIQPFADSRNAANAALHARPRLDVISALAKMAPAPQAHAGVGDCVCCGVFRPKSPGASFPSDARRHARTVPVGTALASRLEASVA